MEASSRNLQIRRVSSREMRESLGERKEDLNWRRGLKRLRDWLNAPFSDFDSFLSFPLFFFLPPMSVSSR